MNIKIYDNLNYKRVIAGKKMTQKYIKQSNDSISLCPIEILSLFLPSYDNTFNEPLNEDEFQLIIPFIDEIQNTEKKPYDFNYIKDIYNLSLRKKFDDEISKKIILVFADYLNNNVDIINDINIDILKSLLN